MVHFRKVCKNCRCGKLEHNVLDNQDPGLTRVGKLFDEKFPQEENSASIGKLFYWSIILS